MNKYLEKIAAKGKLEEHQSRSVDKLLENKGVLLHHSTGSGKTRTILEAVKRIQKQNKDGRQLIITPASLTTNIGKEHDKHGLPIDMSRVETISYEKALNDIDRLKGNKYSLVSIDEGHKLRNTDTKRFKGLEELIGNAEHRLIATATPIYNSPHDISPLVNLVSGKKLLPQNKKDFEGEYIGKESTRPGLVSQFLFGAKPKETTTLKNKTKLKKILNKYVDYYDVKDDPASQKNFPSKSEETFEVPMDKSQETMYKYLEGNIPWIIRMKIRKNMPLDKKESAQLNAFATGVRQVSNSTRPYVSNDHPSLTPKINHAVNELERHHKKDKNFRGLVYSNYLQAGLNDYSEELNRRKINHHVYHGGLTKKEKDQAVADYNSGKVKTLLISSSGAEGLDLKGTKLVQALEPHFNKSKIDQVVGRGARYKSHAHLPSEERHVKVQHFLSTHRPGFFGPSKSTTIDQYLKRNSHNKDEIVDKIKDLMKDNK
jgi:SNF2 family DNA or RNA helicase